MPENSLKKLIKVHLYVEKKWDIKFDLMTKPGISKYSLIDDHKLIL